MANRPIIDIPIDDAKFQRFAAMFNKYQEALKKMPAAWGATNAAITGTEEIVTGIAAVMLATNELSKKHTKEIDKQKTLLEHVSRSMKDIGRSTAGVAKDIGSATLGLLKWGALGLAGGGFGVWGIDRLASGVGATRRASLGVGASFGGYNAFGVNYGQNIDPNSLLQNIGHVVSDPTQGYGIGGVVKSMAAGGMSTDQIASQIIERSVQLFNSSGRNTAMMHATGLDMLFSLEDLKTLSGISPQERAKMASGYATGANSLAVPTETQEKWVALQRALAAAGKEIENVFVTKLVAIAPEIEKLSHVVVRVAESLGDKLGPALERITAWLDRHFGGPSNGGGAHNSDAGFVGMVRGMVKNLEGGTDGVANWAGAIGKYQIKPGTAAQYGYDPNRLTDPAYNEEVATGILTKLHGRYGDNIQEILAAYQGGQGVGDAYRASGDRLSSVPLETQNYLKRGGDMAVKLIIENKTGASVVTSANTMQPP